MYGAWGEVNKKFETGPMVIKYPKNVLKQH